MQYCILNVSIYMYLVIYLSLYIYLYVFVFVYFDLKFKLFISLLLDNPKIQFQQHMCCLSSQLFLALLFSFECCCIFYPGERNDFVVGRRSVRCTLFFVRERYFLYYIIITRPEVFCFFRWNANFTKKAIFCLYLHHCHNY